MKENDAPREKQKSRQGRFDGFLEQSEKNLNSQKYGKGETSFRDSDGLWAWQRFPNGDIVTANKHEIKFLDSKENRIQLLAGHSKDVMALHLLENDSFISGSADGKIKIWKKDKEGKYGCVQTLTGHSDSVLTFGALPDGKFISGSGVSGESGNGEIKIWGKDEEGKYECVQTLAEHSLGVTALSASSDGSVISGSVDGTIKLWGSKAGYELWKTQEMFFQTGVKFYEMGNLSYIEEDNKVKIYRKKEAIYKCVQTLNTGNNENTIFALDLLPDGTIISGSMKGEIKIWEKNKEGEYKLMQTLSEHSGSVVALKVLSDGRTFISASTDKTIKIWKEKNGQYECVQTLKGHSGSIRGVQVLSDNTIISGSEDGTVIAWKPIKKPKAQILTGTSSNESQGEKKNDKEEGVYQRFNSK